MQAQMTREANEEAGIASSGFASSGWHSHRFAQGVTALARQFGREL